MPDLTLGLDLGSRAGKAVLLDAAAGRIVAASILDASPDPAGDAAELTTAVLAASGADRRAVRRIVATGYGRGRAAGADETVTEIACQALGVAAVAPGAVTVVDIGGQDSKAVRLWDGGRVRDFAMNDRCAAGTGRFLEVVARILGTDARGLSDLALASDEASEINSMCVVFAESEVIGMLAGGAGRAEIAAGVVRSLARRVAGLVHRLGAGSPTVFTGGVALNEAMTEALGRELGARPDVPPDPRITGALGAAVHAARSLGCAVAISRGTGFPVAELTGGDRRETIPASVSEAGCARSVWTAAPQDHPRERREIPAPHRVPSVGHFDRMVENAVAYAEAQKAVGRKIVMMFCEYTPREVILAAGAVPVCACGGSHDMAVAGERELPANLCPLVKSSYGFALERENPIFEMSDLVVAETTCDGKKKMYELLERFKPMHVLELPQKPSRNGGAATWRNELDGLARRLESLTGQAVTQDRLRDAIRLMNRERALRRSIAALAGRGLTGGEVLLSKSLISGIPEDLDAYERILAEAEGVDGDGAGRPRILMTGVPMPHGAEKAIEIVEAAGAVVVAQENCTGLKPILEDVDEGAADPMDAIARKYLHIPCSCMTPNDGRRDFVDRLAAEFRPDGVIDLVWQACLTYDVESEVLRRHVERKHGLPYLKIVTDYSPSDAQQLRLRVEAFVSMLR